MSRRRMRLVIATLLLVATAAVADAAVIGAGITGPDRVSEVIWRLACALWELAFAAMTLALYHAQKRGGRG